MILDKKKILYYTQNDAIMVPIKEFSEKSTKTVSDKNLVNNLPFCHFQSAFRPAGSLISITEDEFLYCIKLQFPRIQLTQYFV